MAEPAIARRGWYGDKPVMRFAEAAQDPLIAMQSPAYEADSVVTLTEKGLAAIDELHDGGTSE